jgi:hypothetical protein
MKLFNKTIDRQLFNQYSLGSDLSKQEVVAKIFNPYGAGTWFILNSDPEDPDYLWAIVDLGYGAEVGSVSRSDLENYRGRFGMGFERDLSFDPVNALELYQGLSEGKYYAKGGEIEVVYERRADFKKKPIKLLLLSRGREQKGYTFSGKDQVAVLENYNRNNQEDLEKLWNLKGYETKYADGGDISDFSDNQRMIMNQNVAIEHHHEELEDILEDVVPVPAWVVAKMETATKNLSDITHYLEGQKEIMKDRLEVDDDDDDEIENKEVVEPINVSAGTKAEMTKKFTDDAWGNLRGFLKGMEGIDLRDDYTFDYRDEQFEVEPIINSDENGVSNAVFSIFDGDGEEVGEVAYSREGGKQKFTANSDYFQWNNAKFEDGGYFDGTIPNVSSYMSTYAKGGEIAKAEVFGLKRNIMGTTDIEMKISGMRKSQDFIVYPIGKDDSGDIITIQSETRIGKIDLSSGRGLMSQSHSNGAYFVHFQMDKLTPFTVSESDLEDIKAHIFRTAGSKVGTRGIVSDNSGASRLFADGGETEEGVDLFEDYENIPANLQAILDKYEDAFQDGEYRGLEKALKEANAIGYTFEYYLDGQAYDLRKIGEKGKSEVEEYGKGGRISKFDKLSNKVAKQYEGKPVKKEYQDEYGKTYSKAEAQEVGDKVAGKMKAMTADKKAFGGFFSGAKQLMTPSKKYPNIKGKQGLLKSGQYVQVFEQADNKISVLELSKMGSGVRPRYIDISEVDIDSFKAGGKIAGKRVNGGTETLKRANELAKEIRKDGESWLDAKKRAFAQLKK